MKVLLIQVRVADDSMAAHEQSCIARKSPADTRWSIQNAVVSPADPAWLEEADAVLIGGSGDFSVYDPRSQHWVRPLLSLTETILRRRIPLFGICFGHQLMGKALGRDVHGDPNTAEIGTCRYELTEAGRQDPVFGGLPASFYGQAGHSDCVVGVPDGVTLMASNARLDTQAFRVDGQLAYSVQFHPDLTAAEARERYLAYREGFEHASPEAAQAGAEQFLLDHDDATALIGAFLSHVESQR